MSELYIGLMSGTSADGVDAVLCRINDTGTQVLNSLCTPFAGELQQNLLEVMSSSGPVGLKELGELDRELALAFAGAAQRLLAQAGVDAGNVRAIGSHGQTLYHSPGGERPFTWQAGDPGLIAARTGITTVADFRRKDMALGGQGAPLVPAFHQAMFGSAEAGQAVVNVGGIANLTILDPHGETTGFDVGPGNCLMDAWCRRHRGQPFDQGGDWAAGGSPDAALLAALLAHPFIRQAPPKSTGREQFNENWLEGVLRTSAPTAPARDVQATLLEFTARCIQQALSDSLAGVRQLAVCGGGARNDALMQRLAALLPDTRVCSTAELGLDPDWVEAAAFAWLAHRTLSGLPGNLPAVTGARRPAVLGGIYPP